MLLEFTRTMFNKKQLSKFFPAILTVVIVVFFTISFIRGKSIVKKSEKEINATSQVVESEAKEYALKEIDSETGQVRWSLTAKEGSTVNNLQAAIINDIKANVYKDNEIVFELTAPQAKANSNTKEIYLFGDVITKDKSGNFLLKSTQISLGMGTSIEAQKGFNLELKDRGTVKGQSALINDKQDKITVIDLEEAIFKDLKLSGKNVYLERDNNGEVISANIEHGGKIILKNNSTLQASIIKWKNQGDTEAFGMVTYHSEDKTFNADYIKITKDKKIFAKNNVTIIHGNTRCFGNLLTFENNSFIIITGKPRAIQGDKEILADKIVYDINLRKVQATGNVKTLANQKT